MTAVSAASIARLHTVFATTAFSLALLLGCTLHFKQIVKNGVAGYPEEWFPSVSATIGDWYPERSVFQFFIALTAGPRFALVFLQYFLHSSSKSSLPTVVFLSGIVRTVSCGGWVYVTSTDHHDFHDVMMVLYIVCNVPWMLLGIRATPAARSSVRRKRTAVATAFFASLVPLIYFFIQHKVHRIPGAYTCYAFVEWGLIFLDLLYDSLSEQEFREANLNLNLTTNQDGAESIAVVSNPEKEMKPNERLAVHTETVPVSPAEASIPASQQSLAKIIRQGLSLFSDVYLAFIFWTLLTSLIPTLFYFSVWELAISGHEIAVFSVLSPLLLSLKSPKHYLFSSNGERQDTLLDYVLTRSGQVAMHLASVIGLAAYAIPSPLGRLFAVAFATILATLRQVVVWAGMVEGEDDVGYQALVFGLGVTLSSVLKQANRSNNPLWPFINHKADGYNKTGIVLTLLSIYEYSTRTLVTAPKKAQMPPKSSSKSAFISALPLASLLFSIHNILADPSTTIAWSWTGYENGKPRGPLPHLHGSLTIGAMAIGLGLASCYTASKPQSRIRSIIGSSWWLIFGAARTYAMYKYRDWRGYFGGLGFAVFFVSIIPLVFEQIAEASRGGRLVRTYTWAMFIYSVLNICAVLTVAYAFVPGGVYFREQADLMLITQFVFLLPAFTLPIGSSAQIPFSFSNAPAKLQRTGIWALIALLPILSLLTTLYRLPQGSPQPFKPATRVFNAGIWTVHFGIDNEGHDSQQGMARLIRDMELDIVGLLETDLYRVPFANRDLTRYIVEELNYNVDIGPGPNSHTWGAVLLTKFPIISTKHHLLPSPDGELAPAIEAVLDIYGTKTLVIVAHNGQEETPLDRELQSTELAKIMAASTRPTIFLGYLVTRPHKPRPNPYGITVDEGKMFDIDEDDMVRWCEYILYRGLYRTSYARLSQGIITDTELQIGQFVLPKYGHKVVDDSHPARYLRSRKEELPETHWFPLQYYKMYGGVNGHAYDVFDTPLYYKLPEGAVV